jgi:stage II sporulation protein D
MRPAQNWQMILNRSEVRSRLIAALKLPGSATLKTLHIGGRTPSGRVSAVIAAMEVDGKSRSMQLNSQDFRRIFGFNRIRSTDFTVRWLGEQLEIDGTGIGHGVGMCQTGAKSLAIEGRSYRDILKLYYPKAQLWTLKRT